jgi:hypothetical protein
MQIRCLKELVAFQFQQLQILQGLLHGNYCTCYLLLCLLCVYGCFIIVFMVIAVELAYVCRRINVSEKSKDLIQDSREQQSFVELTDINTASTINPFSIRIGIEGLRERDSDAVCFERFLVLSIS